MKKKTSAPKKTRDLEKTRKEILDAAFMEVFTKGFQGVSVDDIVKKTSQTKGAFYHHSRQSSIWDMRWLMTLLSL